MQYLIEQNGELELPGLPEGKYHPVELETVYVALRGDLSNPYERAQSQAFLEQRARQIENLLADEDLTPKQEFKIICSMMSLVALAPIPVSIEERDRPHLFHKRNERTVTFLPILNIPLDQFEATIAAVPEPQGERSSMPLPQPVRNTIM